jgi:hypothetical protein
MKLIELALLGLSALPALLPAKTTAQALEPDAAEARLVIRRPPQAQPGCEVDLLVGGEAAARLPAGAQVVLDLPAGETNLATHAGGAPDCMVSGAGAASQSVLLQPGETRIYDVSYDASGPFLSPSDETSTGNARP